MNKSLVTKVKGTFDNDTLPVFGSFTMTLSANSKVNVMGCTITADKNFNIVDNQGNVIASNIDFYDLTTVISSERFVQIISDNTTIHIKDKYSGINVLKTKEVTGAAVSNVDVSQYNYSKFRNFDLKKKASNVYGDIDFSTVADPSFIRQFVVETTDNNACSLTIPTSVEFSDTLVDFEYFCRYTASIVNATCDISSFSACKNITKIFLPGVNVTGNLNDLLDAIHSGGRTSGILEVNFNGSQVEYDGTIDVRTGISHSFSFNASGWHEVS